MTAVDPKPRLSIGRVLPLIAVLGLLGLFFAMGWQDYLRPRFISDSADTLQAFVQQNLLVAILAFMGVYVVATALSVPGGSILTILGGFLYGWLFAGLSVIVAATIGATIVFLIAKAGIGDFLRGRAGPFLDRLAKGFEEDAFNYLFFLRLVPLFPFWLVNIAPAFLGVPTRTYIITTFFGIVPGTLAYAYVGESLDSILTSAQADPAFQACLAEEASGARMMGSCNLAVDFGDFVTPQIGIAIIALGFVALIPVALKFYRRTKGMVSE